LPHWHAPLVQLSASVGAHAVHAPPALPQAAGLLGVQVLDVQQPLGQLVPSHTHVPLLQRWPGLHAGPVPHLQLPAEQMSPVAPHDTHAAPERPHAVDAPEVLHVSPEQQPLGQLAAVQPLHTPPVHVCPAAQPSQTPPAAPHDAVVLPLWQTLAEQQPV
jgi:hypothetical protein